jgi:hypothetical protein
MNNPTLVLLISHPNLEPKKITNNLLLIPDSTQMRGDPVITPTGYVVGGKYAYTKWWYEILLTDNSNIKNEFDSLINHLYSHRKFINSISDEKGRTIVFFNIPREVKFNFGVNPEMMMKMAEMKIDFGFEVFS